MVYIITGSQRSIWNWEVKLYKCMMRTACSLEWSISWWCPWAYWQHWCPSFCMKLHKDLAAPVSTQWQFGYSLQFRVNRSADPILILASASWLRMVWIRKPIWCVTSYINHDINYLYGNHYFSNLNSPLLHSANFCLMSYTAGYEQLVLWCTNSHWLSLDFRINSLNGEQPIQVLYQKHDNAITQTIKPLHSSIECWKSLVCVNGASPYNRVLWLKLEMFHSIKFWLKHAPGLLRPPEHCTDLMRQRLWSY